MSVLSSINSPPLIAALTVGTAQALPFIQNYFIQESTSWSIVKTANLLAYGMSILSVSQPGRYDGQASGADGNNSTNTNNTVTSDDDTDAAKRGMDKMASNRSGRTLLAPSGWAFSIWGFIFLGELVMVTTPFLLSDESTSRLEPLIRQVTGPFVTSQLFQTLWTASFRPKYQSWFKYISFANLSGTAYALSKAHGAYTAQSAVGKLTKLDFAMFFLPLSLHFGWTTAASLVNLNGMVVMNDAVSASTVAFLGQASALAATVLGMGITIARQAPVYGGVIVWALTAVASGISNRLNELPEDQDTDAVGVYGAKFQVHLCQVGALLNAVTCAATVLGFTGGWRQ